MPREPGPFPRLETLSFSQETSSANFRRSLSCQRLQRSMVHHPIDCSISCRVVYHIVLWCIISVSSICCRVRAADAVVLRNTLYHSRFFVSHPHPQRFRTTSGERELCFLQAPTPVYRFRFTCKSHGQGLNDRGVCNYVGNCINHFNGRPNVDIALLMHSLEFNRDLGIMLCGFPPRTQGLPQYWN